MGQPGNVLTNHLGLTNVWSLPLHSTETKSFLAPVLDILRNFIKIYINSGIIHTFHLFISNYWNATYFAPSLPVIKTFRFFSKFYRVFTIVNARLKLKKKYILRQNSKSMYATICDPILHRNQIWFLLFIPLNFLYFLDFRTKDDFYTLNKWKSFIYTNMLQTCIYYNTINKF